MLVTHEPPKAASTAIISHNLNLRAHSRLLVAIHQPKKLEVPSSSPQDLPTVSPRMPTPLPLSPRSTCPTPLCPTARPPCCTLLPMTPPTTPLEAPSDVSFPAPCRHALCSFHCSLQPSRLRGGRHPIGVALSPPFVVIIFLASGLVCGRQRIPPLTGCGSAEGGAVHGPK